MQKLMQLIAGLVCCDMMGNPTGQPSIFSNQVVVQITTKSSIVVQKDPVTKQPLYTDAQGTKATKTYINTYWDKKVPLNDLLTMLPQDQIIAAFGTEEAFLAAHKNEADLAAAFG